MESKLVSKEVTYEEAKVIAKFYTDNFIQNIDAYQFIIRELIEVSDEKIEVEVQSPLIPMALSNGSN